MSTGLLFISSQISSIDNVKNAPVLTISFVIHIQSTRYGTLWMSYCYNGFHEAKNNYQAVEYGNICFVKILSPTDWSYDLVMVKFQECNQLLDLKFALRHTFTLLACPTSEFKTTIATYETCPIQSMQQPSPRAYMHITPHTHTHIHSYHMLLKSTLPAQTH